MKKAVMLFTMLLLGMSVPTAVYAETNADVWCETNVENNELAVSIETSGKATDGVIAIGYDPSVISCTEADVEMAESVDMYSVNVVDESVKISFLSENAVDAGAIAEISFEVVDENADEDTLKSAITFTGEAYDEAGGVVIVETVEGQEPGTTETPSETDGPETPTETATPEPSPAETEKPENPAETNTPVNPGDSEGGNGQPGGTDADSGDANASRPAGAAGTGDETDVSAYLILSLVTGGLLAAFAARKFLADTGRKSNH